MPAPAPTPRVLTPKERRERDKQEQSAAWGYVILGLVITAVYGAVAALPASVAWLLVAPGASFSLPLFAGVIAVGGVVAIALPAVTLWLLDRVPRVVRVPDNRWDQLGFAVGAVSGALAAFAFLQWVTGT